MTKDQCTTEWKKALGTSTGDLAKEKALPYFTEYAKADANGDSKIWLKNGQAAIPAW